MLNEAVVQLVTNIIIIITSAAYRNNCTNIQFIFIC